MLKNFPGVSQTHDTREEGMEERGKGMTGKGDRMLGREGKEGKGRERKRKEGNGTEGSYPTFESLPAPIQPRPLRRYPGVQQARQGKYFSYTYRPYGCGCAMDAVI
jgi:hypothetical protein